MSMNTYSIGFIGVGNMGSRMAQRLVDAGHRLTVCDRSETALASFARQGVRVTRRAADCAAADFVLVVVATDNQLLSVALSDDGIRAGLIDGAAPMLIVMSTVMPETVQRVRDELAPLAVRVIDAPISGGLYGAAEGTLTIMVGGAETDYESALPVLRCMGRQLFHCGDLGSGEVTKIINNMVGVTNLYLVAEAYELALKHGLDLARLAPVMDASSGRTFMTQDIAVARAQYATWAESPASFGSLADIIRKDLSLASKLAHQSRLDLPLLDGAIASTSEIGDDVLARWQAVARSRSGRPMTDAAKGYLWAELDIIDPARFENEYSVFVRPLLARYGAKFLIVDEHPRVLEGDRVVRKVVLVEFETPTTAQRFYDDPAYQALVVARNRWSRGHVYLVTGT